MTMLERIKNSYDGLYGQTIHGNNQSTCLVDNCPTCNELLRLKREGLITEFACWGISTYSITAKGRRRLGMFTAGAYPGACNEQTPRLGGLEYVTG